MNNSQLPEDVIDYITSYLNICDICDIYCLERDTEKCVNCNKIWCNKCNSNCGYINWMYFKIHLPICNKCCHDITNNYSPFTNSIIRYHI